MKTYVKAQLLNMKAHPELTEKWVQKLIADDPSIIGLGNLELRAQERTHSGAGRLDLLLQNSETKRRYEVELQLGPTDETHIIRTIEYWDIERKRYPQYEHCAVLIAEDITSRFLNVMSLFNGTIPFIAIQIQAIQLEDKLTVVFTQIMDELTRGLVDEDEDALVAPADRPYWLGRSSDNSMRVVDEAFKLVEELNLSMSPKYNKGYIGVQKNGVAFNFISIRPQRKTVTLEVKLPETSDISEKIDKAGIDALDYDSRWGNYRLRVSSADFKGKADTLRELMKLAYERKGGGVQS